MLEYEGEVQPRTSFGSASAISFEEERHCNAQCANLLNRSAERREVWM